MLEGWATSGEPLDSPTNLRWMRAIATLSLIFSDSYVLFMTGMAVLYIREFTNGWAVYSHSGSAQVITLSEEVQLAATGISNTEHAVLDLDGDIFLRVEVGLPGDLSGDGAVTILDLVTVAQSMGTDEREADVNGDGVVNVFDLVFVVEQF